MKGQDDGTDRIVLARLMLDRKDGNITGIRREAPPKTKSDEPDIDFTAHANPPGTWIDFGKVATDGSLMIRRGKDRLTIFPYPRDKAFRASIDVKAIAPAADLSKLKVHALSAETATDLGPVETKIENGRFVLPLGTPGAGRYVVEWQ